MYSNANIVEKHLDSKDLVAEVVSDLVERLLEAPVVRRGMLKRERERERER